MRSPEDALLLAMWQGRGSWASTSVDAYELASYLEESETRTVPQTRAAIESILTDLHHAGLVDQQTRPLSPAQETVIYHSYVLTEEGLARAHELEAADEHSPPHGDET
jgi:hypothetical protein